MQRLLLGEHAGRALTATVDVLAAVLPELVAMKGFEQRTPYHIYDVLEHTARVLDGVPPYPLVRWAALFHDMGKPAAFFTDEDGTGHFYGHAAISVMLARGIMDRLALSSAFAAQVLTLVERHDDVIDRTPKAVKRALSRLGGGIGTRGPGESKLESDRRHIRSRIDKLRRDLEQVRQVRSVQRRQRKKAELPLVAIVGYTNAGKSTLLNTLTGAGIEANDRLFDTLDPTTRKKRISDTQEILLSDTVGFIRKLPHHLVSAFKATLEELAYADLRLHVVDDSDENW